MESSRPVPAIHRLLWWTTSLLKQPARLSESAAPLPPPPPPQPFISSLRWFAVILLQYTGMQFLELLWCNALGCLYLWKVVYEWKYIDLLSCLQLIPWKKRYTILQTLLVSCFLFSVYNCKALNSTFKVVMNVEQEKKASNTLFST